MKIENDEYFPAWLTILAGMNGMKTKTFLETYGNVRRVSIRTTEGQFLRVRNADCFSKIDSAPTADEILRYHSDYYITLPLFKSERQAGRLSGMLYDDPMYPEMNNSKGKYKYCPVCIAADLKEHQRIIAHTPHQLVDACWKHGTKLITEPNSDMNAEPASTEDIQFARFVYDIYKNPVYTNVSQLLTVHTKKELGLKNSEFAFTAPIEILKTIAKIYGTAENFRKRFPGQDPVFTVTCPDCGKTYLQHRANPRCPACDLAKTICNDLRFVGSWIYLYTISRTRQW